MSTDGSGTPSATSTPQAVLLAEECAIPNPDEYAAFCPAGSCVVSGPAAAAGAGIATGDRSWLNPNQLPGYRISQVTSIHVSDLTFSLPEFLTLCAKRVEGRPHPLGQACSEALDNACLAFIDAGIEAITVHPVHADRQWIQIGIRPAMDSASRGELFRQISDFAKCLLGDSKIDNFFYMNKSPGMRLRFQAAVAGESGDLANELHAEVSRWRTAGLVDQVEPGMYEPESQLFGGPQSMRFVHALFTVDALFWLDYHSHIMDVGDDGNPAWLVSLALIRTIFTGLEISGWEDIGVWERIRTTTGRKLGPEITSLPKYLAIAADICSAWSKLDMATCDFHPAVKGLVSHYGDALAIGASRWRSGYFNQAMASMGPRAATAFFVIFHWNRAGFSSTEQAVIAESLFARLR